METIRDRITAWANTNVRNATVIAQNEAVYNHLQEALAKLLAEPWASLAVGKDMPPANTLSDEAKVK